MPNFFEPEWVAHRYAAARPDVHSTVVEYLRRVLEPCDLLGPALDIGCGTGLSTRPLRTIATRAIGLDPSLPMLREAMRAANASYVCGRAEEIPFPEAFFGLLTIGCAYHWCDPTAFLEEALRVLSPRGYLVIYDSFFLADRPRSTGLFDWLASEYWAHLPRTPRNPLPEIGSFDDPRFELVESSSLDSWVSMSRESLVHYLTTQSGAVAAVESRERSLANLESLLLSGLSQLVPAEGQEVHFAGPVWVVRPAR